MSKPPVATYTLTVDRIDITTEPDSTWLPDFIATMREAGFTMEGGLYVGVSMVAEDGEPVLMDYVPLARRFKPIEREPDNAHEAGLPEFMEYRSFFTDKTGMLGWGGPWVNALIASNEGRLPPEWLARGMEDLGGADGTRH